MATHQLFREHWDTEADLNAYFHKYLGPEILKKLSDSHINFGSWPEISLRAFRELSTLYANVIPEADHVIRADVDTRGHCPPGVEGDLIMYFGYQCSGQGNRSQYTGVALCRDNEGLHFSTFLGGASDEPRRAEMLQREDPQRLLESRKFRTSSDVEAFAIEARSVLERQRSLLVNQKGIPTAGFCPEHCRRYWHLNSRLAENDAATLLWEYFRLRSQKSSGEDMAREKALLSANSGYKKRLIIAYIQDGIPPQTAFELVLNMD